MNELGSEFCDKGLVVEREPRSLKREYRPPRLSCLGNVRELTQAASRSTDTENKSGNPYWKQRP